MLGSPASTAPRSVRRGGSASTLAVASEQAIQAAGPTIQPQCVKKREPSARASTAESTPTAKAWKSALRSRIERFIRLILPGLCETCDGRADGT